MVVDKFKNRMSKWKANSLSFGDLLTLTNSILGTICIYHKSIFKVPVGVITQLESLSTFFYGSDGVDLKIPWIKWEMLLASFDKGGLNVASLKAFNSALLQK